MPLHAEVSATAVSQQLLHLGGPLRMSGAAEAEALREQARPIFTTAEIAFGESSSPQILSAFLPVRVMRIPPEPGGQSFVLICNRPRARSSLILISLGREQPFERRTSELAWVPGMIGADLGIADVGIGHRSRDMAK